ncbi:MAG: hypothetical protein ABIJ18_02835 [archaeon]
MEYIEGLGVEYYEKEQEYCRLLQEVPSEVVKSLNPNFEFLSKPRSSEKTVFIVRDSTDDITKVLKIEPWRSLNGPVCESVALGKLRAIKGIPQIYVSELDTDILPYGQCAYLCEHIEGTPLKQIEFDPLVYLRMGKMVSSFNKRGFMLPCDWKNNTIVDENGQPWLVDLGHIKYYDKDRDFDQGDIFFAIWGGFLRDERSGVPLRK